MGSKDAGKSTRTSARACLPHCKHVTSLPETDMTATQQRPGESVQQSCAPGGSLTGPGQPSGTGQGRWADPRRAGQLAIKMHKIRSHFLMMRERYRDKDGLLSPNLKGSDQGGYFPSAGGTVGQEGVTRGRQNRAHGRLLPCHLQSARQEARVHQWGLLPVLRRAQQQVSGGL